MGGSCSNPTHLINQLLYRILGFKNPLEILSSFYLNMRTTNHPTPRIFGCVFFVHVHSPNKGKLDLRVVKCIFVGYSSTQKGYNRCYYPPSIFFSFFLSQLILLSMKVNLNFPLLIFRGKIPSRKTRNKIIVLLISFSLTILTLLKCLI